MNKKQYCWTWGVGAWGLSSAVAFALYQSGSEDMGFLPWLGISLMFFPAGGYLWGLAMWHMVGSRNTRPGSPLRTLRARDDSGDPNWAWNTFIDQVVSGDENEMSPIVRAAAPAFSYDAEVQNGGHYQYFENSAGRSCHEALEFLVALGLDRHAAILSQAIRTNESMVREPASSVEEFVEGALEEEYEAADEAYYECSPSVIDALEAYVNEHQGELFLLDE